MAILLWDEELLMLSETITIFALPREIFQYWDDLESWAMWNKALKSYDLPDGFNFGSKGWIIGPSGRRIKIKVAHVDYGTSFTLVIKYPLCTLFIDGKLRPARQYTQVTISSRCEGFLASFYAARLAQRLKPIVCTTLDGLKNVAERGLTTN